MKRRVIIDTDAKNEADDQFAIVHALLSPSLQIEGLIAAHFGDRRGPGSMLASRAEIDLLVDLLGQRAQVRVCNGAEHAMKSDQAAVDSAGARLIIDTAHASPDPLFVLFLGSLTDMASALTIDPTIQDTDLTVVWIGGPPYDGKGWAFPDGEYNLHNDVLAANLVFASRLRVWQIPMDVYTNVAVSYAELDAKVAGAGALGAYLVTQLKEFNSRFEKFEMEYRTLGDSPAVGAVLNPTGGVWRERVPQRFTEDGQMSAQTLRNRSVRVYESFDTRFLLEDLFAKLQAFAADRG